MDDLATAIAGGRPQLRAPARAARGRARARRRASSCRKRSGYEQPVVVAVGPADGGAARRGARRARRCAPTPTPSTSARGCWSPRSWARSSRSAGAGSAARRRTSAATWPSRCPATPTTPSSCRWPSRATSRASTACGRARLALPASVLADVDDLRDPIGAAHPLVVAARVAALGGRPADPASMEEHEDAVLAALDAAAGGRLAAPRRPRPRPPRGAAHPAAPGRHGQVGRLPHRVRPSGARLRRQRPRAGRGGGRGAARRRPAGGEAERRPAPRVPQPAPGRRHPRAHRAGRGARRTCKLP